VPPPLRRPPEALSSMAQGLFRRGRRGEVDLCMRMCLDVPIFVCGRGMRIGGEHQPPAGSAARAPPGGGRQARSTPSLRRISVRSFRRPMVPML